MKHQTEVDVLFSKELNSSSIHVVVTHNMSGNIVLSIWLALIMLGSNNNWTLLEIAKY